MAALVSNAGSRDTGNPSHPPVAQVFNLCLSIAAAAPRCTCRPAFTTVDAAVKTLAVLGKVGRSASPSVPARDLRSPPHFLSPPILLWLSLGFVEPHEFRKNRLAPGVRCWESPRHPWLYHETCHSPCRQRETRPSPSGPAWRSQRSRSLSAMRVMKVSTCHHRMARISGGGRWPAWLLTGRSRGLSNPTSRLAARE